MAAPTESPPARVSGGPRTNKFSDLGLVAERKLARYREAIADTPPPGAGLRHNHCWKVACRAVAAGISEIEAIDDWIAATSGTRRQAHSEMRDAYRNAAKNAPKRPVRQYESRRILDLDGYRRRISAEMAGLEGFPELWEASHVRIDWSVKEDPIHLFRTLYHPAEWVYVGDLGQATPGNTLRTAGDWIEYFEAGGRPPGPHWMPNPLTGKGGQTKDGKLSYRAQSCVADYRYAVAEFDPVIQAEKGTDAYHAECQAAKEEQARWWIASHLPIIAVIDAGNKSLHAILRVDASDPKSWDRDIRGRLFQNILGPLGLDTAGTDPAHCSRLPGVARGFHKRAPWQRLCYLGARHGH